MAPRGGRGNFRGGLRGRGGQSSRGRGRGRGRGGQPRGRGAARPHGRGPRFDADRQDEDDQSSENESVNGPEDEAVSSQDESPDEDDDDEENEVEEKAPAKPYMALIQSFAESSGPQAKRRKLDHHGSREPPNSRIETGETNDESEPEGDGSEDGDRERKDPDQVDEQEDAEEDAMSEDVLDDDEDEDAKQSDSLDPFQAHFAEPDEEVAGMRIKTIEQGKWVTKGFATNGTRTVVMMPESGDDTAMSPPPPVSSLNDLNLKQKLRDAMGSKRPKFDATEQAVSSAMFQYQDMLYCNRTVLNAESLRRLTCIHVLNHTFKTRDRIIKNSAKLARENVDPDLELRDQGFTRPKVLFLLPTRNACVKMVDTICLLWPMEQQENKKRFQDSYVDKETKFNEDRPADFRELFDGNDDDMFRLGIKFTRKTIKYFSQFYNSDILFASPLGLRMAIGSEEEKDKKKQLDFDFLSSIEMVVVDQADALLMQNWEHVEYIFEHLNIQPKDAHGCDFGRVRNWYLEDQAKYFRQTIVVSAYNTPELAELFRTQCLNWAGKVRIQPEYPGTIQQLELKARQTFSRFDSRSIGAEPDARFAYFTSAVVPHLIKRAKDSSGTLIFIPSYLDFVRVRNYFATSPAVANLSFGTISEYADVPEASRARSHFLSGRHRVLLYTERAHHFRRYNLKGVQRVIMYGLPENPIFYREIAGGYLAQSELDGRLGPGQATVRSLFCKYDVLRLERIAGSQRVGKMIQDRGDTFDFV